MNPSPELKLGVAPSSITLPTDGVLPDNIPFLQIHFDGV